MGAKKQMRKIAIGLAMAIGAALHAPEANAQFARQDVLGFERATMSDGGSIINKATKQPASPGARAHAEPGVLERGG